MRRGAPLPQVWRDLLPTPRLSHLHFQGRKPGPYRGEPHAGPTLPGESAVRPAHSSPTSGTGHTQVNHLPTLSQDTEASTSRTTPWPQLGLLPREAEALQAPQPRGGPNYAYQSTTGSENRVSPLLRFPVRLQPRAMLCLKTCRQDRVISSMDLAPCLSTAVHSLLMHSMASLHLLISSSVIPFSSCPQSLPAPTPSLLQIPWISWGWTPAVH